MATKQTTRKPRMQIRVMVDGQVVETTIEGTLVALKGAK